MKVTKDFVPYLNVTARIDGAPDQGMLKEKGANYFPYFIFMDKNGKVLIPFRPTTDKAFKEALGTANLVAELGGLVETDKENAAAAAGLKLMAALTSREPQDIKKLDALVKSPGLDARVAERYKKGRDALIEQANVSKINDVFRKASRALRDGGDEAGIIDRRDTAIYALYKKGVVLDKAHRGTFHYFYSLIMGATKAGDMATARKSLPRLEASKKALFKYMDFLVTRGRNIDRIKRTKVAYSKMVEDIRKKVAGDDTTK